MSEGGALSEGGPTTGPSDSDGSGGPKLRVFTDHRAAARAVLDRCDALLAQVPAARAPRLALPTGRSFIPFYAELCARHPKGAGVEGGVAGSGAAEAAAAAWRRAEGLNLDELVLPADHDRSFAAYMREHVWDGSALDASRFSIPDGASVYGGTEADLDRLCAQVDARVAALGPLDLALIGLGADGHVAYNLPHRVEEETHAVELPDALAEELGVPEGERPLRAVTLGFSPLRRARALILLVAGREKAEAVRALFRAATDPGWPCTLLRDHPGFEVYADREAASLLVAD